MSNVQNFKQSIISSGSPGNAKKLQKYFKTGPGEYGEGDIFVGVRVPQLRAIAKENFSILSLDDLQITIADSIHEVRACTLFVLVMKFNNAETDNEKNACFEFYMKNLKFVNNWDLVDLSCAQLFKGRVLGEDSPLRSLAVSDNLWERRIAIVATLLTIKEGNFNTTFYVAKLLLKDPEDLIHKAVGWMLREVGKKNKSAMVGFIRDNVDDMHTTTFRYATEHLTKTESNKLKKKIK